MSEEMILNTSDEAAKFVTGLSGWVDRHGRFFGNDERIARYSGATHTPCADCGAPVTKCYTRCPACREKKAVERYAAMESQKWDGETPLYSDALDEYFYDEDYIRDAAHEHECSLDDLRLIVCQPNHYREIDTDYWQDELPEDGDVSPELVEALGALNRVVRSLGPASWSPGKYAADVSHIKQ